MSYLTLAFSLIFDFIPLILSKTLNLGLEKDTIIATIRSIIQLLAVGYILQFVFDSESSIYIWLMVGLMIVAATQTPKKRNQHSRYHLEIGGDIHFCRGINAKCSDRIGDYSTNSSVCDSHQWNGHWKLDGAWNFIFKSVYGRNG